MHFHLSRDVLKSLKTVYHVTVLTPFNPNLTSEFKEVDPVVSAGVFRPDWKKENEIMSLRSEENLNNMNQ